MVGCALGGEVANSDTLCLVLGQPGAGLVVLGSEVCDSGSRSYVATPCDVSLLLSCCGFCETQCRDHKEGGCGEFRKNLQCVVRRCGPLSTENPSSSELQNHWLHLHTVEGNG